MPVFTHVRFTSVIEPRSSFEAYQEVISLAASTGAHVHICHFNSSSNRDIEFCARVIADAQKRGLKITTEAYPYGRIDRHERGVFSQSELDETASGSITATWSI